MFQKKPSSYEEKPYGNEEEFINFALWLKRTKKLKDKTIKHKLKLLKIILKSGKTLLDTDGIEDYIRGFSSGYANNLGYAYQDYIRYRGYKYGGKEETYDLPLPFIPLEKDSDILIAGFNAKYACFLQLLKEIGCSPLEAYRVTPKNFYLEKQSITIKLAAMITPLVKNAKFNQPVWQVSYRQLRIYFFQKRRKIAEKCACARA